MNNNIPSAHVDSMPKVISGARSKELAERIIAPKAAATGLLAGADCRQKNLGDQHLLRAQTVQRTARPQRGANLAKSGGAAVERMPGIETEELDGAALEAGIGKQQRTERAVAKAGHPAAEAAVGRGRQRGVGKDDRAAVAFKRHLAHPGQAAPRFAAG